jgi:hypothetical protein
MTEYDFDKFMQVIGRREEEQHARVKHYADHHADTPARQQNARYREHQHNRIVYNTGGGE